MKKIICSSLLVLPFLFVACEQASEQYERDGLTLSASEETVVLNADDENAIAVTFKWTPATPIGPDYMFNYMFQMDIAGNNFASAITPVEMGDGVDSISFTAGDLYDCIVDDWGQTAGEVSMVDARIVAQVEGPKFMYPEIATTSISVRTYVPESVPLYLTGSATPAGTDLTKAIQMNEISNGRIYTWNGQLNAGTYKFIDNLGQDYPSWERGSSDTLLVYCESAEQPGELFTIPQGREGTYSIWLSKKEMKIFTSMMTYQELYVVGDGAGTEWSADQGIVMTPDPLQPTIFTARVTLTADGEGEDAFKILTQKDFNGPTFRPTVENGSITSTDVMLTESQTPDYKWKVSEDQNGIYDITLETDPDNLKIEFVKVN